MDVDSLLSEDDLMIRFGAQQMEALLTRLNVDEALPIENNLVSRIVESSQTRVEGANFDVRKHLLEYDDVLNTQRGKIYAQRDRIFMKDDLDDDVSGMLREEVLNRVPKALEDEGGPWKLLAWLEQIQPSLRLNAGLFPSYTLKLLLEDIYSRFSNNNSKFTLKEAREALLQLATTSIEAEKDHHLLTVTNLLEQSQSRMEEQLEERLETLDTFLEGLSLADETEHPPQELAATMNDLLRLPIKLSNSQVRALAIDPEEIRDIIEGQVEKMVTGLTIVRLIGAIERVLKESIGFTTLDLEEKSWDDLSDQVLDGIEETFINRIERFIGNGTPGQIVTDLDTVLGKFGDSVSEKEFYDLMVAVPQGRRAAFDKKTHRRVWVRTDRLTYIYRAAYLLEDRDPDEIAADVLAHLETAQAAIRAEFGQSELNRLAEVQPNQLDKEAQLGLRRALGPDYANIEKQPFGKIAEEYHLRVCKELGRQGLTKIYRQLLLSVISNLWVEYLTQVEALRISIGLEAYAQRDPLVQYKSKAFEMFQQLLSDMRMSVVTRMFTFRTRDQSATQASLSEEAPPPPAEAPPTTEPAAPKKKKRRRRR